MYCGSFNLLTKDGVTIRASSICLANYIDILDGYFCNLVRTNGLGVKVNIVFNSFTEIVFKQIQFAFKR